MPVGCSGGAGGEDSCSSRGTSWDVSEQPCAEDVCRGPYLGTALQHQITYREVEAFFKRSLKQTPKKQHTKTTTHKTKAQVRHPLKKDHPGHSQESFSGVILRDSVSKGKTAVGRYSPEVSKPQGKGEQRALNAECSKQVSLLIIENTLRRQEI